MTFWQEIIFLFVGAGIALAGSFSTSWLNNYFSERSKRMAKRERVYYLTGKYTALRNETVREANEQFLQEVKIFKEGIDKYKVEDYRVDGAIGTLETKIADLERERKKGNS